MNTGTSENRYLSYAHAAAYLDLTVEALKHRVKRGTVPAWCWTRMGGTSIRFIKSALDEWLQPAERAAVLREVHSGDSTRPRAPRLLNKVATRRIG